MEGWLPLGSGSLAVELPSGSVWIFRAGESVSSEVSDFRFLEISLADIAELPLASTFVAFLSGSSIGSSKAGITPFDCFLADRDTAATVDVLFFGGGEVISLVNTLACSSIVLGAAD